MSKTDIVFEDITNGTAVGNVWTGTGVFDKLLAAVNKNIELQYTAGRIRGADYANVYLGGIQSVLQQSIEYVLREKLIAAQVDDVIKGIELKDAQLIEIVDATKRANTELNDNLLTTEKQRLDIDKGIELKESQKKLTYTETVIKDKEAAALGLDNVTKIREESRKVNADYIYIPAYTE